MSFIYLVKLSSVSYNPMFGQSIRFHDSSISNHYISTIFLQPQSSNGSQESRDHYVFFDASRHLKEKGTEATVLDERDGVILSPNQIAGFCD